MKARVGIRVVNLRQHPGCNGHCVNCREDLEPEFLENEQGFDRRILDKIFDRQESLRYYRGELPEEVSHYDPFPEKIRLRCS